jgi:hypothetical protein
MKIISIFIFYFNLDVNQTVETELGIKTSPIPTFSTQRHFTNHIVINDYSFIIIKFKKYYEKYKIMFQISNRNSVCQCKIFVEIL